MEGHRAPPAEGVHAEPQGTTPPRHTTLQLCPYMVAARLMALLWPGPDTHTQNYPNLTEEDSAALSNASSAPSTYLQQMHLHVLERIWTPPG